MAASIGGTLPMAVATPGSVPQGLVSRQVASNSQSTYGFYVSPSGSDANAGTQTSPFLTLAKAQAAARPFLAQGKNVTVALRGGTYYLPSTLALTFADSGLGSALATWNAFPNETPVVSGGAVVTTWTNTSGTIWRASYSGPLPRAVWYNGTRCNRASATWAGGSTTNASGYTSTGGFLNGYGNPTDIELVYTQDFLQPRLPVASVSSTTVVPANPAWLSLTAFCSRTGLSKIPRTVENAYEIFAANLTPGTFYWDRANSYLYLITPDGSNPNTATVVAGALETILSATGTSNLVITGLTFSHTTWLQPSTTDGFVEMQEMAYLVNGTGDFSRTNFLTPSAAAVVFSGCASPQFVRNFVQDVGAVGMLIYAGTTNADTRGTVFRRIGGCAVMLGAGNEVLPAHATAFNTISSCVFHDTGQEFLGSCAVSGFFTDSTTIRNCVFHHMPYSAISLGIGWGEAAASPSVLRNQVVQSCLFHDVMLTMNDGAPIYFNGVFSGQILNNVMHDFGGGGHVAPAIYMDSGPPTVLISGNVSYNQNWATVINLQVNSASFVQNTTSDRSQIDGQSGNTVQAVNVVSSAAAAAYGATIGAGLEVAYSDLAGE